MLRRVSITNHQWGGKPLWEKGFLGDSSPRLLLDTMLYLCGIHFVLRSGEEHRSLQLSQFELVSHPDGSATSCTQKISQSNIQGGLQHCKVKPKIGNLLCHWMFNVSIWHHYANPICHSKIPVDYNTLAATVGRICEDTGIGDFKTNHSLEWLVQLACSIK